MGKGKERKRKEKVSGTISEMTEKVPDTFSLPLPDAGVSDPGIGLRRAG
jgi:hypothetical protein